MVRESTTGAVPLPSTAAASWPNSRPGVVIAVLVLALLAALGPRAAQAAARIRDLDDELLLGDLSVLADVQDNRVRPQGADKEKDKPSELLLVHVVSPIVRTSSFKHERAELLMAVVTCTAALRNQTYQIGWYYFPFLVLISKL